MGNDDTRRLGGLQLVDALGNDTHGVNVESGVCLVQDTEFRFQHSHLEYLVAFLLTAAEALVDGTVGKTVVQFHHLLLLAHQFQELACLQLRLSVVLAFLVDGGLHKVCHRHTRNLHRILERQEQSFVGTVFGLHLQKVLAVEDYLALGHFIDGIAYEHCRQR